MSKAPKTPARPLNIGFVSTRLAGTDGVSLETEKWAHIFAKQGHECYYMAGELDCEPQRGFLVEEAHFEHPTIKDIHSRCFDAETRWRETTDLIHEVKERLKDYLYAFINKFHIDILVVENALAIPVNIPLGVALAELIAETSVAVIAHHHDFFWERQRFLSNAVWDYLNMAFPPHLPSIQHVVINSSADNQLSLRTGVSATIIPNVMDFDSPPPPPDDYASDAREALGLLDDELLILQPTRVVKRKGIEHAIELVSRLGRRAKLVISHASGDEGYEYESRVRQYSALMGVDTVFVSNIIGDYRTRTPDGRKVYSLADVYPHADLVTYPSTFEGFGNAFLEAIYYRKPIVVNSYAIYSTDIRPKGFRVIELEGYVSDDALEFTRKILDRPDFREEMCDRNYDLARRYYSYATLEKKLNGIILDIFGRRSAGDDEYSLLSGER